MRQYIQSSLRVLVLFVLVAAAFVLTKPKSALAFFDCCQTCQTRFQTCISNCTGTPLQIAACRSGCTRQESLCMEVCPACL